jgi:hypothetical protein
MSDELRGCGPVCNPCGPVNDCGCNSEILFFVLIFLILFTNAGCCNR